MAHFILQLFTTAAMIFFVTWAVCQGGDDELSTTKK